MEETKTDYALMKETEQNKRALLREDKCDKYDYLAAVACGAVGGLVDIFLVGTPGDSVLGKWTDSQVDNAVKGFAKLVGWNPSQAQTGNVASAIKTKAAPTFSNNSQSASNVRGYFAKSFLSLNWVGFTKSLDRKSVV